MGKVNTGGARAHQEMVITPGGLRPIGNVDLIEPGYHLSSKNGVLRKIHTASGRVERDYGPINPDRSSTRKALRVSRRSFAPQPITDQWIVYAGWTNDSRSPISYFATEWEVPPPPASQEDQLIYLFNGIENAGADVILQPVLQWGSSPSGGGPYWSVANWYVGTPGSGLAKHSQLVRVNPGDIVKGVMTITSQSNGEFDYLSSFAGLDCDLSVTDAGELVWAVQTLECYRLKQFSDYPATTMTAMKGIEIKTGAREARVQWTPYNDVTDNGQHCNIVNDASPGGEIDLFYS